MNEASIYTLNNGEKGVEEDRLLYQHNVFLRITKTMVPKNIKCHLESLGRAPRIADVGTGTGIWLRDFASEFSSDARLDGYDLDESKFLSSTVLPPNVRLSSGDLLKPFPQELQGQYDLVHARLLMIALKADEWEVAAQNLKRLVKPGGYILWEELGFPKFTAVPITEAIQKWNSIDVRHGISVGRDVTSPMQLERQFRQAGYVECSHQDHSSFSESADVQKMAGNLLVNYGRQSLTGIVARGGFEWLQSHEDVEEICDQLQAEIDDGTTVMGLEMHWTIGRNPA
ncbi:hypothetical protein F66182_1370 [Fusarium sp. NRRL 66182]|nr:hypothetical protein F66182_1370 [Fusarium sp. NRRL 66182]